MEEHMPEEVAARFEELAALEHEFEVADEEISKSHSLSYQTPTRAIGASSYRRVTLLRASNYTCFIDATTVMLTPT